MATTPTLSAERIDRAFAAVKAAAAAFHDFDPAGWFALGIAAAVEPDRRADALAVAHAVAAACGRGQLLDVVTAQVRASIESSPTFVACPCPAEALQAIDSLIAAHLLVDVLSLDDRAVLTAPCDVWRRLCGDRET
jgi:hypothetical protein